MSGRADEEFDADLARLLDATIRPGQVVATISRGKPNEIDGVVPEGVWVTTQRSNDKGGSQLVPAWMFNEAWRALQRDGVVTGPGLVEVAKRSSAVLAILAQLPGVRVEGTSPIVLRRV